MRRKVPDVRPGDQLVLEGVFHRESRFRSILRRLKLNHKPLEPVVFVAHVSDTQPEYVCISDDNQHLFRMRHDSHAR